MGLLKEANLWTRSFSQHYKRLAEPESDIGRALTNAELACLDSVASSNDAWMVAHNAELLATNTGMRGGEIKALRLGNVDLERRRIIVRREGTKSDTSPFATGPACIVQSTTISLLTTTPTRTGSVPSG